MATIKERAHQYGCKIAGGHYLGGLRGMMYESNRDAYIEIATEQHNIDIALLKGILDDLMIDTRDKAVIIDLMDKHREDEHTIFTYGDDAKRKSGSVQSDYDGEDSFHERLAEDLAELTDELKEKGFPTDVLKLK